MVASVQTVDVASLPLALALPLTMIAGGPIRARVHTRSRDVTQRYFGTPSEE